jgi:eukaryotic-like serine/threonine-protein kinase
MDGARLHRVQALFHDAADLPETDRRSFLEAACGTDDHLKAEVLAMIEEDARGGSLLDRDVAQVVQQMLGLSPTQMAALQFGPYRIQELLGEGGMGVVYLGEREDLGSRVAIKILRDAWMSPARRERFTTEQRTLAQLNHPLIARLYDADTLDDGTPWFAMEYVEGLPLTEYCRERAPSIEDRLRLFRSVCEAVQYAHGHAVIHRDLKPSNILVKPDGTVRLLDFGIAKQLDSFDLPVDQTLTGLRLMTPAYAAPEQVRGEPVGVHTDVYSLGVVLYELLVGRLPFDLSNRTPAEAEVIVLQSEAEKPSTALGKPAGKAQWADLDVLCLTAMHKDVARRYRSVEALIRDIDHFLEGEPLEARPDSFRYRLGKFVRRNRRAIAAAALASTVLVALVVFFTVRLAKARNSALAEAARAQRTQQFMRNLFEGGDRSAGPARSLQVVTLLERGAQEARTLDREPVVQAELYSTLGSLYEKLGDLGRADSLLGSALVQRRRVLGPAHPEVAESLVALGLLRVEQARLDEAERLVREGLESEKRTLPAGDPRIAEATAALGKVLEERGQYDQAIRTLNEAVTLRSSGGAATPELADTLLELANTQFYAGHYAESDSLNQRVLAMHRQLYGDRHARVADDLINLGAVQFEYGHYTEAERLYRQALEINEAWYGKDHPEVASNLTMLGRALVHQNRGDEATALLQQSLAIRERVYGGNHPTVASTLNELGSIALQRDRLDEAEAYFRRDLEIYRAVHGDKHYLTGIALSNLGSVYLARKDNSRAEVLFGQAIDIYGRTLPAGHLYTGIARIKLGRALVRQQRYREAETQSLAGYNILIKQTSPSVSWLHSARQDLITIYEGLHQEANADPFRSQLAAEKAPKK